VKVLTAKRWKANAAIEPPMDTDLFWWGERPREQKVFCSVAARRQTAGDQIQNGGALPRRRYADTPLRHGHLFTLLLVKFSELFPKIFTQRMQKWMAWHNRAQVRPVEPADRPEKLAV
jgi:hypothetical protein